MKIYNFEDSLLTDTQRGIEIVAPHLKKVEGIYGYVDSSFDDSYIPVISGGGAGHEPSDWGFVGGNMLTASITGKLFEPPMPEEIIKVAKAVTKKKRAFFIIKNFEKDVRVFEQAIEYLRNIGWSIEYGIVNDDISVDASSLRKYRRGLAGTILIEKIIGTLAKKGKSLVDLKMVCEQLLPETKTIGLAFSDSVLYKKSCHTLSLGKDDIYYGIGIHGEAGYRKEHWQKSELMAREIVNKMRLNFRWQKKENVALLVNNIGKISPMEELTFTADITELLELEGLNIPFIKTGSFMTSHDMSGISVSILRLQDKWLEYLKQPSTCYAWPNSI